MIDDDLMKAALQVSGLKTKRDVVEEALRLLVRRGEQQKIRALRGKLNWEGNLDEIRGGG